MERKTSCQLTASLSLLVNLELEKSLSEIKIWIEMSSSLYRFKGQDCTIISIVQIDVFLNNMIKVNIWILKQFKMVVCFKQDLEKFNILKFYFNIVVKFLVENNNYNC